MSFKDLTSNKNFLSPFGYRLVLTRLPNVDFFCQNVRTPLVMLGSVEVPNPFQALQLPGTGINFGNLSVTFKIDEDMQNYREIFDWIEALGITDDFKNYAALANTPVIASKKVFSDGSLVILSSSKNPNQELTFVEMFPVSLSGMNFNSTSADIQYMEASVEFKFRRFYIKSIKSS